MSDADNKAKFINGLRAHSIARYGVIDWPRLFADYDADRDGRIVKEELSQLVIDAGIAGRMTSGLWARKVIEAVDKDADAGVTMAELAIAFEIVGPPTPTAPARRTLTRAEAKEIAIRLRQGIAYDLGQLTQAEAAMVEDWSVQLARDELAAKRDAQRVPGAASTVPIRPPAPPIIDVDSPTLRAVPSSAPSSAPSIGSGIAASVIGGLVLLALAGRRR